MSIGDSLDKGILDDIAGAVAKAERKHGRQELEASDLGNGKPTLMHSEWLVIFTEEIGEVAKAILERHGDEAVYDELMDATGVLVSWAESIRRSLAGQQAAKTDQEKTDGKYCNRSDG